MENTSGKKRLTFLLIFTSSMYESLVRKKKTLDTRVEIALTPDFMHMYIYM